MSQTNKFLIAIAAVASVFVFAGGPTQALAAGSDTTTFNVKITIANSCDISTTAPTDIDFGSFNDVASANGATGTTNLNVKCTKNAAATIALTPGNADTTGAGVMTLSANTIAYQLYQDSGDTTVWGDVAGTNTLSYTGTGSADTVPAYAKVTGTVEVPAGIYTDTVTAKITY